MRGITMKTTTPTPAPAKTPTPKRPSAARTRLIDSATRLFYEEGIHAVGVDRIIDEAAVTRATLYNQFGGKENLVLAYLRNEDEMLRALFAQAGAEVTDPAQLVDAVIEGIAADIRLRHTRGCPFINAAAEYPDADGAVRRLIDEHREWFRSTLQAVAEQAGLESPADVAASLVLLRDAALVGGYLDGDERVTPAFTRTARSVVESHRPR
jgi:AcrR family transcriptional regulator